MEGCSKNLSYLIFLSSTGLGGAERQALNFVDFLKQKNISASLILPDSKGIVVDICEQNKIPYFCLVQNNTLINFLIKITCFIFRNLLKKEWPGFSYIPYFVLFLYKHHFDVIISYCSFANTISGFSKFFYPKKSFLVWSQRDAGINNCPQFFQKRAIKNFDLIVANSISGKDFIEKQYHEKCLVILNGVKLKPVQHSKTYWKEKLKLTDDETIAIMIANVHQNKDHLTLLKAWKQVCMNYSQKKIVLLLAGRLYDGWKELENFVTENNLSENVLFLDRVDDISGLLQICDISVFSSNSEGSPNGVIEACLAGLPVAATDLPVIEDIVCDENREFLSPKGDFNNMSQNIIKLISEKEKAIELGMKNKKKVEVMFDSNRNFSLLLSEIESLVSK